MTADANLRNMSHRGRLSLHPPTWRGAWWRATVYATGATLEAPSADELLEQVNRNLRGATNGRETNPQG